VVRELERLDEADRRPFEEVEERRARVELERVEDPRKRKPRDPDREDLVVPERAALEEPEARRQRQDSRRSGRGERGRPASIAPGIDGLS